MVDPLISLTVTYAVLCGVVGGLKRLAGVAPIGLVPGDWTWKHVVAIMTVEFATMAGWVHALTTTDQTGSVETAALFAQAMLVLWIVLALGQAVWCESPTVIFVLVGITVLLMPVFAAIAVWSRGPYRWMVWAHAAHRVLLDGWWATEVVAASRG